MNIENLLHQEIEQRLQDLGTMEAGTSDYNIAVNSVSKLMEKAIEIDKFNQECEDKAKEDAFKSKQLEEEGRDRLVKNIIAGAGIAIPSIITVWGTLKSLKFEETGTVTTGVGRAFINRLFHKK